MRDIRFRAWDGKKITKEFALWSDGRIHSRISGFAKKPEPLILMQYTGLNDKNSKEIYEGDIVYLAGYGNYQVEFPFIELYEAGAENDIGEIIGNIYENKELLNEEKR